MKRSSASAASSSVQPDKPVRIKITSLGPPASGKSCLIKRFCESRFVSKYISTIGVDYGVKPHTVEGQQVRVNFWDLSGHPEFFEIRNEFYKDTQGLVLVYDASDANSFEDVAAYLQEARKFGVKSVPSVLCANKVDLRRQVSEDEGREFAAAHGLEYFETSAASGANVTEVFEHVFSAVVKSMRT